MTDVRRSGRAVIIDDADRVLLLYGPISERPARSAWYLPGGRLEPGESFEEATVRELAEELGLESVALGPWIWTRHARRSNRSGWIATTARFFLVRTTGFVPDLTAIGSSELGVEWRWWPLDDLALEPPERLIPSGLPQLIRPLLRGDLPASPLDVSDHD